jgi:transitional endoplasmic reticulum ATPase
VPYLFFLLLANSQFRCFFIILYYKNDKPEAAILEEEEVSKSHKSTGKKKKKKKESISEESTSKSVKVPTIKSELESKRSKKSTPTKTKENEKPPEVVDFSQAILKGSTGSNTMQVYHVSEEASNGHTVVGMTENAMESLGIFDGDTVSVKGKRGKKTVVTVAVVSESDASLLGGASDQGGIGMSMDTMKNVGVRAGDTVQVTAHPHVKFGKTVLILPYKDSLEQAEVDLDKKETQDMIFDGYLRPYFEGKFRTLHRGDSFQIDGPLGLLSFQCVEIDTVEVDNDSSCIVVDDTAIECEGEPIERDPYDDLDNAGYDSIGGASKHLAAIRELVELPLKHPELWTKLGINPPRGVLLTGPSGCGKTSLARAVAAETGAYFFVINGPEVISKRAGESETNLRRAFEDAAEHADDYGGAIVFIDEIDSIAPKREKAGGEVEKRIVSQLLTLMDGLKPSSKVIVIGATNRPTVLESALRRPGRFDRELDMGIPDESGRLEILQIKTRDMRLAKDVDLQTLARGTHGFVGADLQQLCMEAALECIRSKMGLIDFDADKVDKKILDSILIEAKHFDHAMGIVHPSSLRESQVEVPNVHWEDVGGLEDVKRELHETVQYPVEHADKYIKFGMSPSKGVLFYGPSGCGKTLLAKAIANECGANFISIKGPELLTQWFGESEANVRELFDKARAAAPCILMFDEMDSIAKARGSGKKKAFRFACFIDQYAFSVTQIVVLKLYLTAGGPGGSEAGDRVINQILTEIDGVGARKNVFVIGATNRPDILDPAVIRPGRLDQLIYIPLPDLQSRLSIFKASMRKAPLDPEVDLEVLARSTNGFSGADIAEVCQQASKLAIREAILHEEERLKKVEAGLLKPEEGKMKEDHMLIGKRHFNFAMSKARKSVSENDLILYEEFAEKQKAGRGAAATNFKFQDVSGEGELTSDALPDEELYED